MTVAIIYTRFSPRPNAQDCDSCEKQYIRCRDYCNNREHKIINSYADENVSGGVLDRPGITAAINKIRHRPEENVVLVVDSVNRLARDMLVALTIRHEIAQAGGRIEYADGSPDDTTPEGELFSNILAAFAAYERSRIRHATSRGMKKRQGDGEWFGKPPVGFMRDPECSTKLIECEKEQRAIKKAQAMQGSFTSEEIAEILTLKVGPFRGSPWSARTIRKILQKSPNQIK